MLRSQWKFQFSAKKLLAGAVKKREHHKERLKFWQDAKEKVMQDVRESGIEVSESEAGASYSNAMRTPQVMVRNDLQTRLTECHRKIMEHTSTISEYAGWVNVLEGNINVSLELNADDYLYFFGE